MLAELTRYWYQDAPKILLPFSWLFGVCAATRRALYRNGVLATVHADMPVIVVGNITTGGTGKTPFVIWLARWLREQGFRPGIVSRGVGASQIQREPHLVSLHNKAEEVGDEALLLVQQTQCPLVVCRNRAAAVRALAQHTNCNIVISDDGLQHYRMARDIEIAIVDGERRFGNGALLPAGPLREPVSRLDNVNMVIVNGGKQDELTMRLRPVEFIPVGSQPSRPSRQGFALPQGERLEIHAIAGIGHPDRFFQLLRQQGFTVIPHVFPDHYLYRASDLEFNDDLPIVMTEKDAVKCKAFANERCWYLSVETIVDERIAVQLQSLIRGIQERNK